MASGSTSILVHDDSRIPNEYTIDGDPQMMQSSEVRYDEGRDLLFVLNGSTLEVYSGTAAGPSTPIRNMTLPTRVTAFAYDSPADELFLVVDRTSIQVYPGSGAGAVQPLRTISGPSTTLVAPAGVAICH